MASVASQMIEEVTAHAQSNSLQDALEICADGTYFPNNLRNSTSCSLAHLMQNILYLHDSTCRVRSKDITNTCIARVCQAVELFCTVCYTVTHDLTFHGHKSPQNIFKLTGALHSLKYICGR